MKASATLSTIFGDTVVLLAQTDVESAQVDEGPTGALDLKPSLTCVTKATSIKKMRWPTKSWVPCLEAEDRKCRASNVLTELGLDEDVRDRTRRRCGACSKYLLVMHLGRAHISIDVPRDTPLSPANIGYPLISKTFLQVLKNQLIHIRNGCISDDPTKLPYKAVKEVNYPNTGIMLVEVKSLRGTSKNETMHSVMACSFYCYNNISKQTYNARCF